MHLFMTASTMIDISMACSSITVDTLTLMHQILQKKLD